MPDVVTIGQIRDLIKAEKVKPSDLFGAETLAEDPSVKGLVESETKRAVAGEYAHRKRTEEGFDKTKEELEKKLKERETELGTLKLETAKGRAKSLYEAQKATRKLTPRQATFIEGRLDKFSPRKVEEVEKEFNLYLDSEIDEFGKVAKLLGIEEKKADGDGSGDGAGKAGGTEPEDTKSDGKVENKYLDPQKNPFIKLA